MAKPPSKTTVAQMNPKVPIPDAAFSSTARRSAKSVSFFSGALTDGLITSAAFVALLVLASMLLIRGSNIVGLMLPASLSLTLSYICTAFTLHGNALIHPFLAKIWELN
ncbi:UNVERIFIED_CONTAM: hypothetical protein Sradi_1663200 [Sesamum radiatum]|uniref:Uncharacterized protein n=1 Tax=Sesamum radiatum TaxID=300843 RepID=A0AAW2UEB0_SESRA